MSELKPTFIGFVPETPDALLLFQAVIDGVLEPAKVRPNAGERPDAIQSGKVYIFKEGSVIKRWTDKVSWSPSRVLGNFLIYREVKNKKSRKPKIGPDLTDESIRQQGPMYERRNGRSVECSLLGSLVGSFDFKENGLVKKTIPLHYRGQKYRLISYYTVADVVCGRLVSPDQVPVLRNIQISSELLNEMQFQMPLSRVHYAADEGVPHPNPVPTHDVQELPPDMRGVPPMHETPNNLMGYVKAEEMIPHEYNPMIQHPNYYFQQPTPDFGGGMMNPNYLNNNPFISRNNTSANPNDLYVDEYNPDMTGHSYELYQQ